MADNNVVSSGGTGIASILTICFVIMKCTGFISWSWWWVFSPLWISAGIGLGILAIVGIALLCAAIASRS